MKQSNLAKVMYRNAMFANQQILKALAEEEARKNPSIPTGLDYNPALMQSLNIRLHNNDIGQVLNRHFPACLEYIEKRALHEPQSIGEWTMPPHTSPVLTPIPKGWMPRQVTERLRKNKVGKGHRVTGRQLMLQRLAMTGTGHFTG